MVDKQMKEKFSRLGEGLISDVKQKRAEAFWVQKSMKLEAHPIALAWVGSSHKNR